MDPNFLQSILGTLKPEDGSANPYPQQAPAPAAPQPATVPGADPATQNVLSAIIGGGQPPQAPEAPQAPQAPPQVPGYAPPAAAPQPAADTARPKVRSSLLDHIGRLADVFATVGGAQAQYQPNLDKIQEHQIAMDDHARGVQDKNQAFTKGQQALQDHSNKILALTTKSLTAIQAAGGDPSKALGVMAQQFGLDPEHTATLQAAIAANPANLAAINSALGKADKDEAGLAPVYLKDAHGNVKLVQLSKDGSLIEPKMPEGFAPAGNLTQVDQGDRKAMVDSRSGQVQTVLGVNGKPASDEVLTRDANGNPVAAAPIRGSKLATDNARDDRKVDIQQQQANTTAAKGAKPGKAGDDKADPYTIYTGAKSQLRMMSEAMADLRNDPDLHGATGYVMGAVDTPAHQKINAKVQAIVGMSVPVATAILKAQGVARPAQAEVLATAKGLVSDLGLLRQSTGNYVSSIDRAQTNLAQRVRALDETAVRTGVVKSRSAPASAAPAASGGWGKATIVGK